jgi:hypothetical protein
MSRMVPGTGASSQSSNLLQVRSTPIKNTVFRYHAAMAGIVHDPVKAGTARYRGWSNEGICPLCRAVGTSV